MIDTARAVAAVGKARNIHWTDPATGRSRRFLLTVDVARMVLRVHDGLSEEKRRALAGLPPPRLLVAVYRLANGL